MLQGDCSQPQDRDTDAGWVHDCEGGKVLEEALKLPQGTRAKLAGRLILSLDEEDDDGRGRIAAEKDRRLENFDASRGGALPLAKVKRKILRSRRARARVIQSKWSRRRRTEGEVSSSS